MERTFLWFWQTVEERRQYLNQRYQKNIAKQQEIERKIEELQKKKDTLKEEQDEMEEIEILKEYRSIHISIEEFLDMMRRYKKERQEEKRKEHVQTLQNDEQTTISKEEIKDETDMEK